MKIKIFLKTKNEDTLIDYWIRYHSHLVGFENIHIIDNMSTNKIVLDIYEKYTNKINIIYDNQSHLMEGNIMTNIMNKYKDQCDIMIPLDTDEFLVYYNQKENKILQDKDIILNSLDFFVNSDIECSCLHELKCIFNIKDNYYKFENPVKECNQFIFHYWDNMKNKIAGQTCMVKSNTFKEMTSGNHYAYTNNNKVYYNDEIAIIHYHNIGPDAEMNKAKRLAYGYGYINSEMDLLEQYIKLRLLRYPSAIYSIHLYRDYILKNICYDTFMNTFMNKPSIDCFKEIVEFMKNTKHINRVNIETKLKNYLIKFDNKDYFSDLNKKTIIFYDYQIANGCSTENPIYFILDI